VFTSAVLVGVAVVITGTVTVMPSRLENVRPETAATSRPTGFGYWDVKYGVRL
jgi:hypothetical protein